MSAKEQNIPNTVIKLNLLNILQIASDWPQNLAERDQFLKCNSRMKNDNVKIYVIQNNQFKKEYHED